jgi:type II secretory pathway pseudopilin PulG
MAIEQFISLVGIAVQLVIAIVLAVTAIILASTLRSILVQVRTQRELLEAELLYDHFQMYVKGNEPVSDERIKELKLYPVDYMDVEVYEQQYKGKDKDEAIHKYIYMSDLYEYLAFSYGMPEAKIPSRESLEKWTRDLCKEKEFREVHEYYWEYYPDFAEVVKRLLEEKGPGSRPKKSKSTGKY